ncbi:hypothetical protein MTR67_051554, partial [Solanum verrucosum]
TGATLDPSLHSRGYYGAYPSLLIIMPNMRGRRARSPEEPPTNGELRDALTMLAQVVANQVQQGAQAP